MLSSTEKINILVTLDENYIPYLNVMLSSLLHSNPETCFDVYLLHSSISEGSLKDTKRILNNQGCLIPIKADDLWLDNAPTTSRYPKEMYFRIFAALYLPQSLDRVLYLDPDIVVNGSVSKLYNLPMDDYYFAAASHVGGVLRAVNALRLDMESDSPYINSGVMLMNLNRLRNEQKYDVVFDFIEKRKNRFILPDQDIISSLYGTKIFTLNPFQYNMTELLYQQHHPFEKDLTIDWIRSHSVIIHYCGRNKPWKNNYVGQLDVFYYEALERMKCKLK